MKKYSRFNFFKHTYCEWQQVPMEVIANRAPNYKSKAGSAYYFDEIGVYRYSNHWGRAANCRWKLISTSAKNSVYCLAYASWDSFYPNNEQQALFVIVLDSEGEVGFRHRDSLAKEERDLAVCRTAKETSSRIKKIKEIQTTTAWHKHIDSMSIEEARELLVLGLINTEKSILELRRELLASQEK
ncbi:hypothetical protein [Myroides pelagicus]|uniref:Uncharacterized protein n=1 Tax=Myroides pelagicus TaxID=270914 RepID=A0A7K1GTX3_9FLAO|nr:hypothetical protein [Myroides pelagicus]MTH31084.1 hypothetical protein [Myroides pelagicus]